MIKKIIIDNFMAHAGTELELGPGVTALTGPNNTGKSAIVEALRCVATNPRPKNFIRHGAKEARVTIEMDDGSKVVWIRKKRSAGYEVTLPGKTEPEEEIWKLQGKIPDEVREVLKLDLVDLGRDKVIDVHIGNQRSPIFLLDQPDSDAAAFFAASTESAHLLAMQNVLKRRTQDAKRREKELEVRIREIEDEMDRLDPLPSIEVELETAREMDGLVHRLQALIPALESTLESREYLDRNILKSRSTAAVLKDISEPSKLNEVKSLVATMDRLDGTNRNLGRASNVGLALGRLEGPPELDNAGALARLLGQLGGTESRLRMAEKIGASLHGLAPVQDLQETAHLAETMDNIISARHRVNRVARWQDVLRMVAEPPEVENHNALARIVLDMDALTARKQSAEARLAGLEKELDSVKDGIRNCVDRLGRCPTCGADLNSEAFIDQGCRHDA